MKGTSKSKVVTSGRLTGRVGGVTQTGRRVPPNPEPGARPEPAYSLYSTDSEDQVASLHKGLDRCAALLSGLLQADQSEAPQSPPKAKRAEAAKRRPSTSLGKKSIKKTPKQKDRNRSGSVQHRPTRPLTAHQSPVLAAHSGVKLHPPRKRPDGRPYISPGAGPRPRSPNPPGPPDEEEEEVAVKDVGPGGPATGVVGHPQVHGIASGVSVDEVSRGGEDGGAAPETVQHLLGELKALIAGRGSVAEKLLSHLETVLSSPPVNEPDTQTGPEVSALRSQNAELCMRVRMLQQQLNEAEAQPTLRNPEASALHEDLTVAQSRLRELQEDLAGLREALRDAQDRLGSQEAENALMKSDLEAAKSRLVNCEREKSELASLAKQRLEQIGLLNRTLPGRSSPCPEDACLRRVDWHGPDPGCPADRVVHYLRSLDQEQTSRTPLPHPDESQDGGHAPAETSDHGFAAGRCPETERLSLCGSTWSGWSARSGSTFNTRDEAAFRDGLVALDASIASLQKTIQLDLGR